MKKLTVWALLATFVVAGSFFAPPQRGVGAETTVHSRTPATKKTMRTILTKAGWSNREIQALRGMIRALVHPRSR